MFPSPSLANMCQVVLGQCDRVDLRWTSSGDVHGEGGHVPPDVRLALLLQLLMAQSKLKPEAQVATRSAFNKCD